MSSDPAHLVGDAIARLVGGDPLAALLLSEATRRHPDSFDAAAARAIVTASFTEPLLVATALADTRRKRQHLAVVEHWLINERDRSRLLAREHLAEFPDDVVISWLMNQR